MPLSGADGFAVNGYIYLMGGRSADTCCRPMTLVAPISANTTITSGNKPTGMGSGMKLISDTPVIATALLPSTMTAKLTSSAVPVEAR